MANEEHLAILRQGVKVWKRWRGEHGDKWPDLSGADLSGADLRRADLGRVNLRGADLRRADLSESLLIGADLSGVRLSEADLSKANLIEALLRGANLIEVLLRGADLSEANLSEAFLSRANLSRADLSRANLSGALLSWADLSRANLSGANLSGANLHGANLRGANLGEADLRRATIGSTMFADNDLSTITGLDTVEHDGPSEISTNTLVKSNGNIPQVFLRGCGMPDTWIDYLPSLIGAMQPIQFYSCFISYSSKDEAFARRLHERMQTAHLRVWFAPEAIKGGQKFDEQIEEAIRVYDKVVVILSRQSLQSKWVMDELRKARKAELKTNRRKLFPIRLMPIERLRYWECIDVDDFGTKHDIANEVREYHIPDFSRWKQHVSFECEFARLLEALKAVDEPPVPGPQPNLTTKKRRLCVLEEQQATFGPYVPPHIIIEIEDLRRTIAEAEGGVRGGGR